MRRRKQRAGERRPWWARLADEAGATAIEYALIAGLIGVALIGALGLIGTNVGSLFNTVATEVADAAPEE